MLGVTEYVLGVGRGGGRKVPALPTLKQKKAETRTSSLAFSKCITGEGRESGEGGREGGREGGCGNHLSSFPLRIKHAIIPNM